MRRLFLELYHKQIFPSTPITSFSPFLSYIVVTPLMLGFEKDFSCHSHLGPIRIPPLFPFPPAPFPRNEKEDGTLELYYLSAYCLPKILLLHLDRIDFPYNWIVKLSLLRTVTSIVNLLAHGTNHIRVSKLPQKRVMLIGGLSPFCHALPFSHWQPFPCCSR